MDASRTDKLRLNFVVELVSYPYVIAFFKGVVFGFPVVGRSVSLTLRVGVLVGFLVDFEGRSQHLAKELTTGDIFRRVRGWR